MWAGPDPTQTNLVTGEKSGGWTESLTAKQGVFSVFNEFQRGLAV